MSNRNPFAPSGRLQFSDARGPALSVRVRDFGARVLTTFYRRMFMLVTPLNKSDPSFFPAGMDVDNDFILPSAIPEYLEFRPDTHKSDIVRRFAGGHRCFVSRHEGRIVDACWVASGNVFVTYLNRFLLLPPRDVYVYDAYTVADYRGHSIASTRGGRLRQILASEGFTRVVALVAFENLTAWTVLTWVAMETIGAYYYVRFPPPGIHWIRAREGSDIPSLSR